MARSQHTRRTIPNRACTCGQGDALGEYFLARSGAKRHDVA